MPPIKRYHPVSHDLNSDHEIWEMTDKIGDRSLRVWLEFLSIADRNDGRLPPWSDAFAIAIGHRCRTIPTKVRQVWDHAHAKTWIVSDPSPRIAKYTKYHRTREQVSTRPGTIQALSEPSEPSEPIRIHKDEEPASPEPAAHRQNGPPVWHVVADRLYQTDKARFKSLFAWANGISVNGGFSQVNIRDALLNFEAFEQRNGAVDDWYPYLKKVLEKTTVKANIKQSELKHEEFKKQETKWAKNLQDGKMTTNQLVSGIASHLEAKK